MIKKETMILSKDELQAVIEYVKTFGHIFYSYKLIEKINEIKNRYEIVWEE